MRLGAPLGRDRGVKQTTGDPHRLPGMPAPAGSLRATPPIDCMGCFFGRDGRLVKGRVS